MRTYEEILAKMQTRYHELAGFEADDASDIGIRLKVLAEQIYELCAEAQRVEKQIFPQTGDGIYLDMHAETRGIKRKEALAAVGRLRFRRENPAVSDIDIEAGIICSTRLSPQVRFITTEPGILPAGENSVTIPAVAMDYGAVGNVAANAVSVMVSAAPGISLVENPQSFSGGVDAESDEALRDRLLKSYMYISNSTNSAFYYDLAMGADGVESVNIIPRARGRGTVDVIVAVQEDMPVQTVVNALQQELNVKKEVNVDVVVEAAEAVSADVNIQLEAAAGNDFDTVAENCDKAVKAYFKALHVGEKLLTAGISSAVMNTAGVKNCRIILPAADVNASNVQIVRPGNVNISRI